MATWELLSAQGHASLRVRRASASGRHFVQVVPGEFAAVAARCPIFLTKRADTGEFYAGAVFGFTAGENLLVDGRGELDGTMPLDFERQGFFVNGEDIVIDREHDRFNGDGPALFDEDDRPAEPLRRVQHALAGLNVGMAETDDFIRLLLKHRLVEPIDIALAFDDGERITLEGLYTVSQDALADLDDEAVVALFRHGALRLAHIMIASLKQVPLLARRRNDRLLG